MLKRSEREKQQPVVPRRRIAQRLGPWQPERLWAKLKPLVMKVTEGNDGAVAAGIALAATMQSFVCTLATSLVQTWPTEFKIALLKRISRLDVGLPSTKLLLQLTQQLLVIHISFPLRPRFPVKYSVLCIYNTYRYHNVTNCSTEVGEQPILFFWALSKRGLD